jgi:hypothetical protein
MGPACFRLAAEEVLLRECDSRSLCSKAQWSVPAHPAGNKAFGQPATWSLKSTGAVRIDFGPCSQSLTGRSAWRQSRASDYLRRRQEAAAPVQRSRSSDSRTLPNGARLFDGPPTCQSNPHTAPCPLIPEAGDQAPQHQTHPHEPEERHEQPMVCLVWCICSGGR